MTRRVATALDGSWEHELVAALEGTARYRVARRCADLPEALAVAAAGLADVVLVSPDLRSLDRAAVHELGSHGVVTAAVVAPGDEAGEQRLRQLGLSVVLRSDVTSPDLEDALDGLHDAAGPDADRDAAPGIDPRSASRDGTGEGDQPVTSGRLIAVWGPAGAPGRSTVAVNLAAELSLVAPTLLVDCDTYASCVAQALGLLDEAPGVAAAARAAEHGSLDLNQLARVAPEVTRGLRVLTGLPRPDRWSELRAASVSHLLQVARQLSAFIVVDCGFSVEYDEELSYDTLAPRRNAATLSALDAADEIVVVGSADPVGLQRLVRGIQDLSEVSAPASRRVVVNRVRASAVGPSPQRRILEALERFAGLQELVFLPWDQRALDGAMLAGQTLREFAPQCELRQAVRSLADRYTSPEAPMGSRRARRQRQSAAAR